LWFAASTQSEIVVVSNDRVPLESCVDGCDRDSFSLRQSNKKCPVADGVASLIIR